MNHLETGVSNVTTTADAAIPAPIGPASNAGLVYNGSSWVAAKIVNANIDPAAAIVYSKLNVAGSVVNNDISNSAAIAYAKLALSASIQRTDMVAGAKTTVGTWAAGPPGTPTTGDVWLATAVDANGTDWAFLCDSTQTTYKWLFVGGPPLFAEVTTTESLTNQTVYTALATAGPSVALGRGGDFAVEIGALLSSASNGQRSRMSYDIGGTGAVDADCVQFSQASGLNGQELNVSRKRVKTAIAATTTLTAKYRGDAASATTFANRYIAVTPVRVI